MKDPKSVLFSPIWVEMVYSVAEITVDMTVLTFFDTQVDYWEDGGVGFSVYYGCATETNSGDFCGMIWVIIMMICYCLL